MKSKKKAIIFAIIITLPIILYVAVYMKSINEESELTSKRNAILDYLKKNNDTISNKKYVQDNIKPN